MKFSQAENLVDHLRRSNQFYHLITDTRGRLIHANPLFIKDSGYTSLQLSYFCMRDILRAGEADKYDLVIAECLGHTGHVAGTDLYYRSKDDFYTKIYWELFLLAVSDDLPVGGIQWIGVKEKPGASLWEAPQDIAILIESEQRFRNLFHDLNLGMILVNEKGEILICNKATANMFELPESQLAGKNIFQTSLDIIYEDGSKFQIGDFPVAIAIQTKKSVRNIVMGIKNSLGDIRIWLLVSAEPVLDSTGNILHVISSFTDITEQKNLSGQLAEQEIQKQKQLMQATIDGQEKERREIGRELHDNINQHLTTTRLYLEVAKEKAEGELLGMINWAHKGLLDIVTEIQQLSQSLVPPSLNDIGLIASIEDLCEPLKNIHAFTIDFRYHQFNEDRLPDNLKLMVFRIIQEQVSNIIRHANAGAVSIGLQEWADQLVLSIADDGKGFDPATIRKGLGLDNISNRAGLFGGKLKIDSAPGKGCLVQVTIPFP
jgi:PAS domain S-box-containing protein